MEKEKSDSAKAVKSRIEEYIKLNGGELRSKQIKGVIDYLEDIDERLRILEDRVYRIK